MDSNKFKQELKDKIEKLDIPVQFYKDTLTVNQLTRIVVRWEIVKGVKSNEMLACEYGVDKRQIANIRSQVKKAQQLKN